MNKQLIEQLIDRSENTFINSVDEAGYPISRVMLAVRKRVELTVFYFSTNTASNKVKHFHNNPKASLYFFDNIRFIGCLLKGKMEVLEDLEIKKEIWQEGDEQYYPKGVSDPDFTVLKFTTEGVRTYHDFQSEEHAYPP